jgi:hypothetical protein
MKNVVAIQTDCSRLGFSMHASSWTALLMQVSSECGL